MINLEDYTGFNWDKGNIDKNYQKHGISPNESEESCLDDKSIILKDIKHSLKEPRFLLLGKTIEGKLLLVVFTTRGKKIRIISARKASRKEKNIYVKKT